MHIRLASILFIYTFVVSDMTAITLECSIQGSSHFLANLFFLLVVNEVVGQNSDVNVGQAYFSLCPPYGFIPKHDLN